MTYSEVSRQGAIMLKQGTRTCDEWISWAIYGLLTWGPLTVRWNFRRSLRSSACCFCSRNWIWSFWFSSISFSFISKNISVLIQRQKSWITTIRFEDFPLNPFMCQQEETLFQLQMMNWFGLPGVPQQHSAAAASSRWTYPSQPGFCPGSRSCRRGRPSAPSPAVRSAASAAAPGSVLFVAEIRRKRWRHKTRRPRHATSDTAVTLQLPVSLAFLFRIQTGASANHNEASHLFSSFLLFSLSWSLSCCTSQICCCSWKTKSLSTELLSSTDSTLII